MNVMKSITVNRPRGEVYAFWRDFENLPRFMRHLESIEDLGAGRSHWRVKSPVGKVVEWDAEIVEDRRNDRISWRTVGAEDDVRHAGYVLFRDLGNSVTEVEVDLTYDAPGGRIGAIVARLFGEEPGQQIEDDLERLKRVMETGDFERPMDSASEGMGGGRKFQVPVEPVGRELRSDREV